MSPGKSIRLVAALLCVGIGCDGPHKNDTTARLEAHQDIEKAKAAIEKKEFSTAANLLKRKFPTPYESTAQLLLGHTYRETGRPESAIDCYNVARRLSPEKDSLAKCLIADTYFYDLGRSDRAEALFRSAISDKPDHGMANQGLGMLLYIQGRLEEATPFLLSAIKGGRISIRNLVVTGWNQVPSENPVIDLCIERNAADAYAFFAKARVSLYHNKSGKALEHLRRAAKLKADSDCIQAALGMTLLRLGLKSEYKTWSKSLPENSKRHPEIALVLGIAAQNSGNHNLAIQHYLRSFRRNPDKADTVYRIGELLSRSGFKKTGAQFLERSATLEELSLTLGLLSRGNISAERVRLAAQLTEKLGRTIEAFAWYTLLNGAFPSRDAQARLKKLSDQRSTENSNLRTAVGKIEELLSFDIEGLEHLKSTSTTPTPVSRDGQKSKIRFENAANELQINFEFSCGTKQGEETRLHEMMGGGTAIADFDRDGWPDLWCTQAGKWAETNVNATDQIFRNHRGVRFTDITKTAGAEERGYSQGPAIGDVNQDGFDDVYISNVGKNRLFVNNGDGTFHMKAINDTREDWTTSSAVADLNSDGFPEIFSVNYLTGDDAFTRRCNSVRPENDCRPALFTPVRETLLINDSEGDFSMPRKPNGLRIDGAYGLGIVVANFDSDRNLDVFVANDFSANYLYLNRSSNDAGTRFEESGLVNGAALDGDGRYQACMGVAAFDVSNNGRTDLFITNFSDESNTLYEQYESGFFTDRTRARNLRDSGFNLIGFGTQAIDVDNDGLEDLLVTNGALARSVPSSKGDTGMPTLLLKRRNDVFQPLEPKEVGPYFAEGHLGRGVSRSDLNRDGRQDAVISNLDSPLAILINESEEVGNVLTLRLTATSSERNAIGATVTSSTTDGRSTSRNLTAGDGYMASNDRTILIGTGQSTEAEVTITWPSGEVQAAGKLTTDSAWHVVQARPAAKLPK